MLSLNSHQLNVFLIAADTLNFTLAASQLNMTQPSVSQHIQALEDHFGLALFVRSGRSIELTDAGMALIPLARQIVYLSTYIEETMASMIGGVQGHLIVGCSTPTGRYILPKLLALFHKKYPDIRATCHVTTQEEALDMIIQGKAHVSLTSNSEFYNDIDYSKFASEEIVLITHLDHPWTKKKIIDINDLCQDEFILPSVGSDIYIAIQEELARRGLSIYSLKNVMTLGSLEAIALSVQEGLGVGFVPELIVNRLVPRSVSRIQIEGSQIRRDIYLVRSLRRPSTSALEAFWNFVKNESLLFIPEVKGIA